MLTYETQRVWALPMGVQDKAMVLNNMGCVHLSMNQPHTAVLLLAKALQQATQTPGTAAPDSTAVSQRSQVRVCCTQTMA